MIPLTIVTLVKDNPLELATTVSSLRGLRHKINFLLIDGSNERLNLSALIDSDLFCLFNRLQHIHCPDVKGIYKSMNFSLGFVETPLLMFLNSGDGLLSDPHDTCQYIIKHNLNGASHCSQVRLGNRSLYLYPSPSVKNVNLWLHFFYQLPNHQSIIFSTHWALHNLYDVRFSVSADNHVKKLLVDSGRFKHFPVVLNYFALGGASSSSYSSFSLEHHLMPLGKHIRLYSKFFAAKVFRGYPIVSIIKNQIINFVCTIIP